MADGRNANHEHYDMNRRDMLRGIIRYGAFLCTRVVGRCGAVGARFVLVEGALDTPGRVAFCYTSC